MAKAKSATITVDTAAAEAQIASAQGHIEAAQAALDAARPVEGPRLLRHDQIRVGGANPRKFFDEESLAALADNIAEHGLLENLVVRPTPDDPDTFELVAGERRWRAIGLLIEAERWGAATPIHCLVKSLDDGQHRALALIENLQRKDLRPLEEAAALKDLIDLTGASTADVAVQIGFTQRFVQQRLQLLELSEADQTRLNDGKINIEDARRILAHRPEPIVLSPEARLLFLELAHRHGDGKYWDPIFVDAQADTLAETEGTPLAELTAKLFVSSGEHDWKTGQSLVRFTYGGRFALQGLTGSYEIDKAKIEAALAACRAEIGAGEGFTPYLNVWLNPPFEIPQERLDEIQERDARHAAARRETEALQAKRASEISLAEQGRGAAAQLAFDDFTSPEKQPAVQDAMAKIGWPMPWKWIEETECEEAHLLAANGANVWLGDEIGADALLAAALHRSVGLTLERVTPPPVAEDDDEDDEGGDTGDFDDGDDDDLDAGAPPAGDVFAQQIRQAAAEVSE